MLGKIQEISMMKITREKKTVLRRKLLDLLMNRKSVNMYEVATVFERNRVKISKEGLH